MKFAHNQSPRVVLLHTNDIHSRLEQASKIASYITDQRRLYGEERLLVVDCGDHMDRMRVETEYSGGRVNIELMNAASYEAAAIGNNEGLTFGKEVLKQAYATSARFPVVCANLIDMDSGEPPEWMLSRLLVEKNGLTIGITSVTAKYDPFYRLLGWEVKDPFPEVREQVAWLRSRADVVVVMSHLGLPSDERMAAQIGGIDLIVGGHTHHLLHEPLIVSGTTICAAGKFGDYLGRIEIDLNPGTGRPVFRAECVPTAACGENPQAASIISRFREAGELQMSRVVARLPGPLPVRAERESPFGNLLAAGLRRWTAAEIGIVNTGQLLGGLGEGDVTEGQLHALCPSPVNPCRILLSGRQIRTALEEALLAEFIDMPLRGYGFRGLVLGTLAIDGIEVVYDPEQPVYRKIISITMEDKEWADENFYLVGTIDMFTFGAGYKSLQNGLEVKYFMPEFIRDVLAAQLSDEEAVRDASRVRWWMWNP